MTTVPVIPESAPFNAEQRAWLNGYLAGLFSRGPVNPAAAHLAKNAPVAEALKPLTILFGSQTGTAESLAKRAARDAGKRGFAATVMDMAGFTAAQLSQERNVLIITSTYGEGEPPDNAKTLHAALTVAAGAGEATNAGPARIDSPDAGNKTPPLTKLRYSVCGLGDTNYLQFCQCAKDFDARLEKLGAMRVASRVDCDLDYEEKFSAWLRIALGAFDENGVSGAAEPVAPPGTPNPEPGTPTAQIATPPAEPGRNFSRQNPFPALLLTSRNLNAAGSAKQVHHVEFELAGSDLHYEAGDALGVFAHNCPELVQDVLGALGCDGEEAVPTPDGNTTSLRRAFTEFYDLGKPPAELFATLGLASRHDAVVGSRAKSAPTVVSEPAHLQVIDVLLAVTGGKPAPGDFVRCLKKLQPRLYSISSSPKAHPNQVHLTVGAVRYIHAGRARKGVCSTFLTDRAQAGTTRAGIFVHPNKSFRPPASGDTPMIMVGPGTGIAPFRAFLEERRAAGAKGKNWLFFGDQRGATDFLYRDELAGLMRENILTRLDTAFSRDQAEKIYVQQRMMENAAELYAWLEAGAHFYVCGDASRMAKDVEGALHKVIETAGGKTPEQAAEYVTSLRATKRYARDVY